MLQLSSASDNRRNTKLDESICPSLYFNQLIEMPAQKDKSMANTKNFSIWPDIPADALLIRQQVVAILHIGMSTLDSLIPDSELPRVRLSKRLFVLKKIWKLTFLYIVQLEEQKFQWEVLHVRRQYFYPGTPGIKKSPDSTRRMFHHIYLP